MEVDGAYYMHMHEEGFSNNVITNWYYRDATIDVTNVIRSCITPLVKLWPRGRGWRKLSLV